MSPGVAACTIHGSNLSAHLVFEQHTQCHFHGSGAVADCVCHNRINHGANHRGFVSLLHQQHGARDEVDTPVVKSQQTPFYSSELVCVGSQTNTIIHSSATHNLTGRPFSPKNQRRLLPCFLYKSVFFGWSRCYSNTVTIYEYVWFLGQKYVNKSRTYSVASTSAVTLSVFMRRFRYFSGQCD